MEEIPNEIFLRLEVSGDIIIGPVPELPHYEVHWQTRRLIWRTGEEARRLNMLWPISIEVPMNKCPVSPQRIGTEARRRNDLDYVAAFTR
jgi:hypothetical protein